MGYGYIGSYLVYGFPLEIDNDEEFVESLDCLRACFYKLDENLFIKEWGFETPGGDCRYWIFWKCCFRGGEWWEPYQAETPYCLNEITLKKQQEIEESFDEKYVRSICDKYGIRYQTPRWQTLITIGQLLY
jgi:hypothetical protein